MTGSAAFIWRFGQAEFDEARWQLRVGGTPQELEPRPLEVMQYLLRHAGEVVSRAELMEAVYGHQHIGDGALANAIGKLRKVLDDDGQKIIATVHRVGYRFIAPVTRVNIADIERPPLSLKAGDAVHKREHWKLLRPLGSGRETEVWLAEHDKTRDLRVFKFSPDGARLSALKREATLFRVIKETLGEREDFVRVLDWNFDEIPFFLECEYGGQNLIEWAQHIGGINFLPRQQRIELAAQIAKAVAAAHSAGVLHKDLKPANVLMFQSAAGLWRPRLTDFGSGRLLEPERLASLGITQLGFTQTQALTSDSRTGTPLYLAPEVINGQAPTALADIYALGVILYQLAVGDLRRLLAPGWEQDVDDEMLRQDIAAAAAGDPSKRLTSAAELSSRLQNLDARMEARARARAAAERAAQLQGRLDRARTRRPWLIAAVTALIAGLAASLWFYRTAVRARDEARDQADIANAVVTFFNQDVLSAGSPFTVSDSNGKPLTARETVDRALANLGNRFAARPAVEAAIRAAVGQVYVEDGDYDAAEAQIQHAVDLYRAMPDAEGAAALQAEYGLVFALTVQQKFDRAQALLNHANEVFARLPDVDAKLALRHDGINGNYYFALQQYDRALPFNQKALVDILAADPTDISKLVIRQTSLALSYAHLNQFDAAMPLFRNALDEVGAVEKNGGTLTGTIQGRYGIGLFLQRKYIDAERVLGQAYSGLSTAIGPSDGLTAESLTYLGWIQLKQGHAAQAEAMLRNAYAVELNNAGPTHPMTLRAHACLGMAEFANTQPVAGLQDLVAAVRGYDQVLGVAAPEGQLFKFWLAFDDLATGGHLAEAEQIVGTIDAEKIRLEAPAEDWPAQLKLLRAELAWTKGQRDLANQSVREALDSLRKTGNPDPAELAAAEKMLASVP